MPSYQPCRTALLAAALLATTPAARAQAPPVAPQSAATTAPAPEPAGPPTEAEKALDAAIKQMQKRKSIAADLDQTVGMLNQTFRVKGRYLKDTGYRALLQLDLDGPAEMAGRMLQVSDGVTLWDYSQILGQQSCRKLQLAKILAKLDSPEVEADFRERILTGIGFAGPEALVAGLRKTFTFDQKEEGTYDGKEVWILRGRWKDYEGLNGPGQPAIMPGAPLPPFVPQNVTVWLGREDGWPYKVQLRGRRLSKLEMKRDDRPIGPDGKPIGVKAPPQKEDPTEIVLIYSNVRLDQKIDPADFAFSPGPNLPVADQTEQILAGLDNAVAERAAQQRAKAAGEGGDASTLPAIPVTSPPDGASKDAGEFRSTAPPPR